MINSVLIANRGEIAIRIAQTLRKMNIRSVGIYTYADAQSPHLDHVDERVLIGSSYIDIDAVVAAAKSGNAQAVHPGYGFLSENAEFAKACVEEGLIFVGPSPQAIAAMGGKIAAREFAVAAGVPVIPGAVAATDQELLDAAPAIGFPLLIKPSAGGGGKGLHVANSVDEVARLLPVARREAMSSFGDDALFIERYLARPRHIEFQVLGDSSGNVLHLGERECTLQRRHQKVIEEAPSPLLSPEMRARMGAAAVALAKKIGYQSAGTVEFLVDADDPEQFFFIEMNTRLQVEHRVTELVFGVDLVELQVRIARGELLADLVEAPKPVGHSIQARVYAEDPANGFLPTGGPVLLFRPASDALTDTAINTGSYVSSSYDPMLAKVIVHGENRDAAIAKLHRALNETVIFGLTTNLNYLDQLTTSTGFASGQFDTGFIAGFPAQAPEVSARALAAYADALQAGDGWRLNADAVTDVVGYLGETKVKAPVGTRRAEAITTLIDGDQVWIHDPQTGTLMIARRNPSARSGALGSEVALAPMPGVVIQVAVEAGQRVHEGDPLVVLEAMKMEHQLRAAHAGIVEDVWVAAGDKVAARTRLVRVRADG